MVDPIYRKTEAGQEEIRTRARKLEHKLRALLLIVNGERQQSELLAQVSGMGVGPDALDTLLSLGLIETTEVGAGAAAATPPAATGTTVPAAPALAAALATAHEGDAYRQLYHFYTDVIGHHLGLRGYVLQVKVEKASSVGELAALRDMLGLALQKAKGELTARAIIEQLDQLLASAGPVSIRG